jgi:hypothetical protein
MAFFSSSINRCRCDPEVLSSSKKFQALKEFLLIHPTKSRGKMQGAPVRLGERNNVTQSRKGR